MMISSSDKEALWTLCFNDTQETAESFFEISDIETLTESSDGRLVGMATLIPVSSDNGLSGSYVYGVCVHPDFRGKGIFRLLMNRCEQIAISRGEDFLCLIPADRALMETYRKAGYNINISLPESAKPSDISIHTRSKEFAKFAKPDAVLVSQDVFGGLMKPLSDKCKKNMTYSFSEHMGEI